MSNVLLVRPHDFIVEEMLAVLQQAGFRPIRLSDLGELSRFEAGSVSGSVISTAVTSVVPQSFGEVLDRVRSAFPAIPLVAATLSHDFEKAASVVRSELNGKHRDLVIVPFEEVLKPGATASANRLLLLRQKDLASRAPEVTRALRAHFRPPTRDWR